MTRPLLALAVAAALTATVVARQNPGLLPAQILKPSPESWPTFHGDYSGRHYSTLDQINKANVKSLSLAWTSRLNTSLQGAIIGGKGPEPAPGAVLNANIKATPLIVNGTLYLATPNNAYALDARTGRQLWHYYWKSLGGSTIGNRGLGMWGNYLFLDTPDQHLVSLEAATGKERWNQQKADYRGDLYATTAPTVIGNRVFTPAGGDYTDVPGWLESRDPETGALQWKWYATPRAGEAGIESWPNAFAAELCRHGQSAAGADRRQPTGRQPLDLLDRGAARRDGEDGLAFPGVASRHARLGRHADAGAHRRDRQRPAPQAAGTGEPQRHVLSAGSRHR